MPRPSRTTSICVEGVVQGLKALEEPCWASAEALVAGGKSFMDFINPVYQVDHDGKSRNSSALALLLELLSDSRAQQTVS